MTVAQDVLASADPLAAQATAAHSAATEDLGADEARTAARALLGAARAASNATAQKVAQDVIGTLADAAGALAGGNQAQLAQAAQTLAGVQASVQAVQANLQAGVTLVDAAQRLALNPQGALTTDATTLASVLRVAGEYAQRSKAPGLARAVTLLTSLAKHASDLAARKANQQPPAPLTPLEFTLGVSVPFALDALSGDPSQKYVTAGLMGASKTLTALAEARAGGTP